MWIFYFADTLSEILTPKQPINNILASLILTTQSRVSSSLHDAEISVRTAEFTPGTFKENKPHASQIPYPQTQRAFAPWRSRGL